MNADKKIFGFSYYDELAARYDYEDNIKQRYKSLAGLAVMSATAIFGCFILGLLMPYGASIAISIIFWIWALVFFAIAKEFKKMSPLNPFFNSAAVGFAMAAFCKYQEFAVMAKLLGMVAGGFLASNIILWTVVTLLPFKKTLSIVNVLIPVAVAIFSVLKWSSRPELFCLILFLSIFYFGIAAAFAIYTFNPRNDFWACLHIGYSFVAILIIIVVIAIISEGDFSIDAFDLGIDFGGGKNAKTKKLK